MLLVLLSSRSGAGHVCHRKQSKSEDSVLDIQSGVCSIWLKLFPSGLALHGVLSGPSHCL